MFNPCVTPGPEILLAKGPEALRAIIAADGMALDAALDGLGAGDLAALWEMAMFLEHACRVASRGRGW